MTSLLTDEGTDAYWQRMCRLCGYEKREKKKEKQANERMNNLYLTMKERTEKKD
jgi:hypothetical protein